MFICHLYHFFDEVCIEIFPLSPFFNIGCLFSSHLVVESSLYVLYTSILSDIRFVNVFSQSTGWILTPFTAYLRKDFIFKIPIYYFFLSESCLSCHKNPLTNVVSQRLFVLFFITEGFCFLFVLVSGVICRSMMCLE